MDSKIGEWLRCHQYVATWTTLMAVIAILYEMVARP